MSNTPVLDRFNDIFDTLPPEMQQVIIFDIARTALVKLKHDAATNPAEGEAFLGAAWTALSNYLCQLKTDEPPPPMPVQAQASTMVLSAYFAHRGDFTKALEAIEKSMRELE